MKPVNVQISIFIRSLLADRSQLLGLVNSFTIAIKELGYSPIMLPVPDAAPPEVPLAILKSQDGRFELVLSRDKIGFTIRNIGRHTLDQEVIELESRVGALLTGVGDKVANRVGVIFEMERDMGQAETAAMYLQRRFLVDRDTNNPLFDQAHALQIRHVSRTINGNPRLIVGRQSNLLIILSQRGDGLGQEDNVLYGQFDLNTIPEDMESLKMSVTEVQNYIREAIRILKTLPSRYMLEDKDSEQK